MAKLSGVRVRSADDAFTLRDASGSDVHLPPDRIATAVRGTVSLMPEGLLSALSHDEIRDLLARYLAKHGFRLERIHYYHWHAAPPHLQKTHKDAFWKASLALERKDDWRAMFLCSALVAEIVPV